MFGTEGKRWTIEHAGGVTMRKANRLQMEYCVCEKFHREPDGTDPELQDFGVRQKSLKGNICTGRRATRTINNFKVRRLYREEQSLRHQGI